MVTCQSHNLKLVGSIPASGNNVTIQTSIKLYWLLNKLFKFFAIFSFNL